MSIDHGVIEISMDGEIYELRPTLKAMKRIQTRFGGLRGALEAIAALNVESVAYIIAAGADAPPRDIPDIEQKVFDEGVSNVTEQIVPFVTAMINPRGLSSEGEKKSSKAK
jgi:hypothetical protein